MAAVQTAHNAYRKKTLHCSNKKMSKRQDKIASSIDARSNTDAIPIAHLHTSTVPILGATARVRYPSAERGARLSTQPVLILFLPTNSAPETSDHRYVLNRGSTSTAHGVQVRSRQLSQVAIGHAVAPSLIRCHLNPTGAPTLTTRAVSPPPPPLPRRLSTIAGRSWHRAISGPPR